MRKTFCYTLLLLLVLSMCSVDALAAQGKAKKITKKYHNERLIVVLNDLCERNGYRLNIVDEIDEDKRITEEFKNAEVSTVLRKVLDSDCQGKVRKGVLTITRKVTPPTTYLVQAPGPAKVIDNDTLTSKIYQDTLFSVACKTKTIEHKPEQPVVAEEPQPEKDTTMVHRYEHNIQVLLGGGYSSMGYQLGSDGLETGRFGGNVQLRYLYYFTPNWGIGAGVGFANYGSTGVLNTTTIFTPHVNDSDVPLSGTKGEDYEHHVKTHDWTERQQTYMIDVPVMVQCTYPIRQAMMENGPLKIYADLGVDLGLSIAASRRLTGGSIEHVGWYAPWKLELSQINGHDFYTELASDFETDQQALAIRKPAVGLMADLGVALPLTENLDLLIGLYATYTANDVCVNKQDIGWQQPNASGYKVHDFMNTYNGIIGTQYASTIHPWQAGLRVGINFNTRTQVRKPVPVQESTFERIQVCDTTFTLQERVETTYKVIEVQQIKRALEKSVIWFDLNSTEPKLEPADILIQVAEVLKENPDMRILVTGHASKEGNKEKNQQLSEDRAKAVVDMLVELGVRPEQMDSQGEGVDRDYVQGDHDISLDRRVEITVIE